MILLLLMEADQDWLGEQKSGGEQVNLILLSRVSSCGWGFYYPALSEAEAREQPLFFTGLRKRLILRFFGV
ncbi:hypothetical protein [Desulfotomaculum copahuensis]|nr:hypothetical protein [Desulfotomaculum copahuensis]